MPGSFREVIPLYSILSEESPMNTPKWLMPPQHGAVVGAEDILSCFLAADTIWLYKRT